MAARLARTEALRTKISARMSEIDDYMNWCEATKAKTQSGKFADYLSAAEQQNEMRPRRHDALSIYLDALEERLEN
jgi:Tfp pilus assembly protein FimT